MSDVRLATLKSALLASMLALASGFFYGCSTPYTSRPRLTVLQDVHVRSLRATADAVWFVDAAGRNGALTAGFVAKDGQVRRASFTLKDASLLPNIPPGAGVTIQPLSGTTACLTLSAAYPSPHEVAIATVHLDGRHPSLAVEKGVEDLGTLVLFRHRLFAGESRQALMELQGGRLVDHWLPKDARAPKNTLFAVTDYRGHVVVGDGRSSRVGVFSPGDGTWTFANLAGVSNFSSLAFSSDGSAWVLSDAGRLLTKTAPGFALQKTFDLTPSAGFGLAVLRNNVACTGSSNGEDAITCVSATGRVMRTNVALAYPPTVVASSGGHLWYALTDLHAPSWSFGDPDWGSAVGQMAVQLR